MKKPHILIVDDDPLNVKRLEATLRNNYDITVASNGRECIQIAASDSAPDLILLDVMMPEMDGYETCRRLKAESRTQSIPVIFIQGSAFHVRRTFAKIRIKNRECYLVSFLDITDIKDLMKKQEMNINQAKKILNHVNGRCPRYIDLSDELVLFIDAVSVPCYAEGGDHLFVSTLEQGGRNGSPKSIISLKDQTGHEVGCILRSIYTDILHKSMVHVGEGYLEKSLDRLNDEICRSEVFHDERIQRLASFAKVGKITKPSEPDHPCGKKLFQIILAGYISYQNCSQHF